MPQTSLFNAIKFKIPARLNKAAACRILVCACLCCVGMTETGLAAEKNPNEPGWLPVVVARGSLREQIDATPIENRPYRPFHFYGNTIRRMHYRGTPFPRFGEVVATPVRAVARRPRTELADYSSEQRQQSRR